MAVLATTARLNAVRVNAFRLNAGGYVPTFFINGTAVTTKVRKYESEILEYANDTPNTCSLVVRGTQPSEGQQVTARLGGNIIFDGQATAVTQIQPRVGTRKRWRVDAQDWTPLLNRRLVYGSFSGSTPNALITAVLGFTSGFTTTNVQLGLTWLNSVTSADWTFFGEPVASALAKIADAVGGTFKLLYFKDIYLKTTSTLAAPLTLNTSAVGSGKRFLNLHYSRKTDQIRTRVDVQGVSVPLAAAAAVGDTSIAVADTSPFSASGGKVITDDGQILTYTGLSAAAGLTGPTAPTPALGHFDPTTALAVSSYTNPGGGPGAVTTATPHGMAIGDAFVMQGNSFDGDGPHLVDTVPTASSLTFIRTGGSVTSFAGGTIRRCVIATSILTRAGVATITTNAAHGFAIGATIQIRYALPATYNGNYVIATIPSSTTFTIAGSGHPADAGLTCSVVGIPCGAAVLPATDGQLNGVYSYKNTFASNTAETGPSPASVTITVNQVPAPDASTTTYTTSGGGSLTASSTYKYGFTALTSSGETDVGTQATINLAIGNTKVSATSLFPTTMWDDTRIQAINIYRSKANGTDLFYLTTISESFTDQVHPLVDVAADTALGGPPPTSNTTGGAVMVSSIPVATTGTVAQRNVYRTAAGGGIYKSALTITDATSTSATDTAADTALGQDVPTTGSAVPGALTGIPASSTGSIGVALGNGSGISLWVQRDDAAAQAALAALEGGDGIHEVQVTDASIVSIDAANARGDAELTIGKNVQEDLSYTTEDGTTQVAAIVTVNISGISTTAKIQQQRVYWVEGRKWPQRDVVASNQFKDLYQYLRQLTEAA